MKNKRGSITFDLLLVTAGMVGTASVWAYTTFVTKEHLAVMKEYRDEQLKGLDKRLENIEGYQRDILKEIRSK